MIVLRFRRKVKSRNLSMKVLISIMRIKISRVLSQSKKNKDFLKQKVANYLQMTIQIKVSKNRVKVIFFT